MDKANPLYASFNFAGVAIAYSMLAISLWLSTEVPLATKGYWAMGILLLTLSLVNFVKFRMDERALADRVRQIEEARNERLLAEYASES